MSYEELWKFAGNSEEDFVNFSRAFIHHKSEMHNAFCEDQWELVGQGVSLGKSTKPLEQRETIAWLFHLAAVYGHFKGLSKDQFNAILEHRENPWAFDSRWLRRYGIGWYGRHGIYYRQRLGFRFEGQAKKEVSEKEKWRRCSGHYRDKAKHGGHHLRGGNLKKHAKKQFNNSYRAEEKHLMDNGRWDQIPKKLCKPWID